MKHRSKTTHFLLTLIFTVSCLSVSAQQSFKFRADVRKPEATGFYKIPLSPDLLAKANDDLSDIRLATANGKFVPYIFGSLLPQKEQKSFLIFPQVNRAAAADTATTLVVENTSRYAVDHLYLQLRNTAAQRKAYLSGSDDLEHWYAIKEDLLIGGATATAGKFEQLLNFPSSTYRYLRLRVHNKQKEPLAILQAGIYQLSTLADPVYIQYPSTTITQLDSASVSHVQIRFKHKSRIDKLSLAITGPKFYKRKFAIYQPAGGRFEQLFNGELNSSAQADFKFSGKADYLLIEIENGDNPPLAISAASAFSLEQSLIAYLEKNTPYQLLAGDSLAVSPNYDLAFFTDSLQRELPQLVHADVELNNIAEKPAGSPALPAWVLWGAITAVVLILLLLTFKMTREVNNRAKGDNN